MELKAQAILKKQGATPRAIKMLNELDWQAAFESDECKDELVFGLETTGAFQKRI